jgi:hypothetical protein
MKCSKILGFIFIFGVSMMIGFNTPSLFDETFDKTSCKINSKTKQEVKGSVVLNGITYATIRFQNVIGYTVETVHGLKSGNFVVDCTNQNCDNNSLYDVSKSVRCFYSPIDNSIRLNRPSNELRTYFIVMCTSFFVSSMLKSIWDCIFPRNKIEF